MDEQKSEQINKQNNEQIKKQTGEPKSNQKRINWVDISKGYGMLLVILGHIIQGPMERWIYSFHVPLFFFMSGFLFSRKENFGVFLKKKCKSLLVPYFAMGVGVILFQSIRGRIIDGEAFTYLSVWNKVLDLFRQIRCWDLWFLACLFWLEIVFFFIVCIGEMCGEKLKPWVIGILSYLITALGFCYYGNGGKGMYWNFDVTLVAMVFFAGGYLFRITNAEKIILFRIWKIPIRGVIFAIALVINLQCYTGSYIKTGQFLDLYMGSFGVPWMTYAAAFAGTLMIIIISHWISFKPIGYIGKNSLVYYCWHQSIMIPIMTSVMGLFGMYPDSDTGRFESVFCMALLFVLTVGGMTLVSYGMNRTKLRYMLGHWE